MNNKWNILLIDSKRSDPNYYICLQVRDSLKRHQDVDSVLLADYSNAMQLARENNCNLLFVYGGEDINKPICKALRNICGNAIAWFTEDPYELSNNIMRSEIFDLVFTNDPECASKYPCTAYFLPLGASQNFHFYPIISNENNYRYDLSFIGTAWPNRTKFINSLIHEKPDRKYKIALPSNEHLPEVNLLIPLSEINWRTPSTELAKIANTSKFSLILHREFSSSGNANKAESPGPRIFEVAMAGGLLLVDDSLDINSELFSPEKEYLPFHSLQECQELIDYYIEKPDERKKIIERSQLRAIQYHTYDHRVNTLMEKVNTNLNQEVLGVGKTNERQPKRLLNVVHNVINVQPFGGVEVYVDSVVKDLKKNYDIFFFISNKKKDNQTSYVLLDADYNLVEEFNFSFPINGVWLSEPERERSYFNLLIKYNIDVVHYHHLLDNIPSLPLISKTLGLRNILSIHDYYYICDSFNLLNYKNEYCDVRNRCIESCDICASKRVNYVNGSIGKRRAFFERVLNSFDVILANSETTKSYYQSIFKSLDRLEVVPIPIPVKNKSLSYPKKLDKFKIAILGNFSPNKGSESFLELFKHMHDEKVEFHVLGNIDLAYINIINSMHLKNVHVHEGYGVSGLQDLLQDMNVSLHLSTWPETFSITLSEAWDNCLIPIVSNIGALSERVTDGVNGFIVPVNDCGAVIHVIRRLISDHELYNSVLANIKSIKLADVDEHIKVLENLYETPERDCFENNSDIQQDISLQSISKGLVKNHLEQFIANAPDLQIQENLELENQDIPNRLKRNLKKTYHFYRSNGIKVTCKRILIEIRKKTL